jgi:hypothetical protein
MNKDFTLYPEAFELKQLGFDEPCTTYIYTGDTGNNVNVPCAVLPSKAENFNEDGLCVSTPTYSQAFRWFREKYDLHVQIRKENYFQQRKYEYYHFDISKGEENDITNQEDLLDEIFNECSQDIPGNHLNDEMYSKLIFEKEFAFKTYEEIELACLRKLIEIVKK